MKIIEHNTKRVLSVKDYDSCFSLDLGIFIMKTNILECTKKRLATKVKKAKIKNMISALILVNILLRR